MNDERAAKVVEHVSIEGNLTLGLDPAPKGSRLGLGFGASSRQVGIADAARYVTGTTVEYGKTGGIGGNDLPAETSQMTIAGDID